MLYLRYIVCFLLCITQISLAQEIKINISKFDDATTLDGWTEKKFVGNTKYEINLLDGKNVLKATSNKTASALFKEQKINLKETPYLNWSWRTDTKTKSFDVGDEKTKKGDDYRVRVYVVRDGGIFIWNTIAINYVWSSTSTKGEMWNNAFVNSNAKMVAVKDGKAPTGTWFTEKRNILEDFKTIYPEETVNKIDAIAIMTDTDNAELMATSYYSNIYFSSN